MRTCKMAIAPDTSMPTAHAYIEASRRNENYTYFKEFTPDNDEGFVDYKSHVFLDNHLCLFSA